MTSRFTKKEPVMFRSIIMAILLVLPAVAPAGAIGPRVIFQSNFETPDLSRWEPQWVPGVEFGPLGAVNGQLVPGDATRGGGNIAAMTMPLEIDATKPLMLELSVRTNWEAKVVLFSEWGNPWSGYIFHFDDDSYIYARRVRIVRMDRNRITQLGSYDTDPSGVFRFDRDPEGNWTLFHNNFPVPEAVIQPDNSYTRFVRVGVMFAGSRRRESGANGINWLRIGRP